MSLNNSSVKSLVRPREDLFSRRPLTTAPTESAAPSPSTHHAGENIDTHQAERHRGDAPENFAAPLLTTTESKSNDCRELDSTTAVSLS